jgi:hypothetical protein
MMAVRALATAAVVLVACVAAPTAHGAATLIAPAPGAVLGTSHPVFTWSVPPNEESDGIFVASSPETTPSGEFFDENYVDGDVFFGNETQWSPTSPLPAGSYWWNVWTHDRDSFDNFYTAPSAFTIRAAAHIGKIATRRYTYLNNIDITVDWKSNTSVVKVTAAIFRGKHRIWSARDADGFVPIGEATQSFFAWYSHGRPRQGTRLRLQVRLDADDVHLTTTRTVRAP